MDSTSPPLEKKQKEAEADLISSLPDCILTSILSLLPIKESARTAILSSRWRHLFTLSPLNIDAHLLNRDGSDSDSDSDSDQESNWRLRTINNILSRHRGPIHTFRLSRLPLHIIFFRTLSRWIETLARSGIQNLSLHYKLPHRLLSCQSLRSLELKDGNFSEPLQLPPNLRELNLHKSILSEDSLSYILSNCRFLDTLDLVECSGLTIVRISSPSLRKFTFNYVGEPYYLLIKLDKLIIEEAPNLELLMLSEFVTSYINVKVINTPKLRLLGFVNADVKKLRFGETRFQNEMPTYLSSRMHSLKTLAIRVNLCDIEEGKTVAGFLRCFPCLESLDILSRDEDSVDHVDTQHWEQEDSSDCLDHHLKFVKIKQFSGQPSELSFARFFIKNARMLKVMSLLCDFRLSKRSEESKRRQLCFENRASVDAQIMFIKDDDQNKFLTWEDLFYKG